MNFSKHFFFSKPTQVKKKFLEKCVFDMYATVYLKFFRNKPSICNLYLLLVYLKIHQKINYDICDISTFFSILSYLKS